MRAFRNSGFTLIELVVVLAIIAALAGLVIPQVANLGRTTDMATSAKCQADVANNIQLFFVLQKRFPQNMDSLITTGTAAIYGPADASGTPTTNANLQTTGLPASSPALYADLTVGALTNGATANDGIDDYLRSVSRAGFDTVMDHDRSVINSNNSATVARAVPGSSGSMNVAEVTAGSAVARAIYPATAGAIPANTRLIAFGFGPSNTAISKTTLQAPIYPGCDGKYYGRYVAVFIVYASGERATLAGVFDAYGRFPDYTIQQYNESLPDGARQG